MWREAKRVLFAQQFAVFVVHILLVVISPIVIIVFNLCNNEDTQIVKGQLIITASKYREGRIWPDTVSVSSITGSQSVPIQLALCILIVYVFPSAFGQYVDVNKSLASKC